MDRKQVREIVEANLDEYIKKFGIPHWNIAICYDMHQSEDSPSFWRRWCRWLKAKGAACGLPIRQRTFITQGRCEYHVDYNEALIYLDPSALHSEDVVLGVLRHELFHVVLSPFEFFREALSHALENDPVKGAMADSLWTFAVEQGVINLERMYEGMKGEECSPT